MPDDAYEAVSRSALKLKVKDAGVEKDSKRKKKHKKKHHKKTKQSKEAEAKLIQEVSGGRPPGSEAPPRDIRTPAERAHARILEARTAEQMLKKAEKSHKERVMEFNTKLENCSEHFDMPKLSWTK